MATGGRRYQAKGVCRRVEDDAGEWPAPQPQPSGQDPRRERAGRSPRIHTGAHETVDQTVIFGQAATARGGPIATNRYRR